MKLVGLFSSSAAEQELHPGCPRLANNGKSFSEFKDAVFQDVVFDNSSV